MPLQQAYTCLSSCSCTFLENRLEECDSNENLATGISFTTKFLNQAGALIHIYTDGSVLVTHGGMPIQHSASHFRRYVRKLLNPLLLTLPDDPVYWMSMLLCTNSILEYITNAHTTTQSRLASGKLKIRKASFLTCSNQVVMR